MKKQNIAVIGVFAFILAVAVGYALFSEAITINGTASAQGNFDVEFTSVGQPTCQGYSGECNAESVATIDPGKNTMTVTVENLQYPTAYVLIPVTITNKGSISAELKEIKETTLTDPSKGVKVTYSGIAVDGSELKTDATQTLTIKVEWDGTKNEPGEKASFKIEPVYEQYVAD